MKLRADMNRNVSLLTAIQALGQLQFHQPVFALLFTLSKGWSLREFFLLQSTFFFTTMMMEIPTGSFSDKVSRKHSLLIGALVAVPTTLVMILSDSFWTVMAAAVVGGVGAAFASGTDTAMLYDSLLSAGREKEFKEVSGRIRWYGGWAMAIAAIVGGALGQLDVTYAWWAWFAVGIPPVFLILALREPAMHREKEAREGYAFHLRESMRRGLTGEAGYFVVYAAAVWMFFSVAYWLWQPYLTLIELPVAWFGVLYFTLGIVGSYASKYAHAAEKVLGMRTCLLLIPALLALALFLESRAIAVIGCAFLALQSVASGFFWPLLDDYVNARIPSERRATILSIKNMLNSLLFSVLSPLVGWYADLYSLGSALLLMSCTLLALAAALWLTAPRVDAVRS